MPATVSVATKTELGRRMVLRALDAGVSCDWVTGDGFYGKNRRLRYELEQRNQPFVLAMGSNERLMVEVGRYRQANQIAKMISDNKWSGFMIGPGFSCFACRSRSRNKLKGTGF